METITATPVRFTDSAIREIGKLLARDGSDQSEFLRVGVKGGGCSGLTYVLGFDKKTAQDTEFVTSGITYIMNSAHEMYLHNMVIDWEDGLNNRGFTFKNPNASTTCGCGTSFAV